MKYTLTILLLLFSLAGFSQSSEIDKTSLWLKDKNIEMDDFVDIHDFKNLRVVSALPSNQLEIQFIVVPFGLNLVSFKQKVDDLKSLDIIQMLSYGKIPVEKIAYVTLSIIQNGEDDPLFSVDVDVREIKIAADYYKEFEAHAEVGDVAGATWNITQAILLDPENLTYLNASARSRFETGQFDLAKNEFQKIILTKPNSTSYLYLGLMEMGAGELKQAMLNAEKSVEYGKENVELSHAYYLVGSIKYHEYNLQSAYDNFKKSLEYLPTNINALNDISAICDDVGREDEKLAYFKRITEVDPDYYQVHINIGFYYLTKEKYQEALDEFNYVLGFEPTQALALSNKAFCLYKLGRTEEALKSINQSLEYDPSNSYGYKNRALIYLKLKDKKAACQDLQKAIQLDYTARYGDEVNELLKKWCK